MKAFSVMLLFAAFVIDVVMSFVQGNSVVQIDSGTVRGFVAVNGAKVYRGIPFAKAERFEHPQKPDPWSNTFNATRNGPPCPQYSMAVSGFPVLRGSSENCLNLNIFAPAEASESSQLPVLFFTGGGSLLVGGGAFYDASVLAKEEKVIVVTYNHRLGAFGFLATGLSDLQGNYGNYDQLEALKWVNHNIKSFGGDPKKVTLSGQSTGSVQASMMLLTPLAHGLYRNVILMSGSAAYPFATATKHEMAENARIFGHSIGCHDIRTLKACVRSKSVEQIIDATKKMPENFESPFRTVVDGVFLRDIGEKLISEGKFSKTDILIGMVSQEGSFMDISLPGFGRALDFTKGLSRKRFQELTDRTHLLRHQNYVMNRAITFEYTDWENTNDPIATLRKALDMAADSYIRVPALLTAKAFAANNYTAYVYQLDYGEKLDRLGRPLPAWMGAPHGGDLVYLFGSPPVRSNVSKQFGRNLRKQFANFMRTSDPNSNSSNEEWPRFTSHKQRLYHLKPMPTISSNFLDDKVYFWSTLLPLMATRVVPPEFTPNPQIEQDFENTKKTLTILTVLFAVLFLILFVILLTCVKSNRSAEDKGTTENTRLQPLMGGIE